MEDVEFKKHVESSFKQALNGKIVLLNFLNENEINIVNHIARNYKSYVSFSGGFNEAEYKRCIISNIECDSFRVKVFEIRYNKKYYTLSHRQILGSLMSLGIKRECIGDIYIQDNKNCYFAATEEITPYLLQEFKYVSNCPIELNEIDYSITINKKYEDKKIFVASLRLDVLVSNVYNISRKETLEIITTGDIKVNYEECLNPTKQINLNDLVSVKHYGRFILKEISGKSRSDRYIVFVSIQV